MRSYTTRLLLTLLPLFLLTSLAAGRTGTRQKVGTLSFAIPKNWTCEPSKTGPGIAIMSPMTHKAGPISRKDVFFARAIPEQGLSLEEFKHSLETMTLAQVKKLADEMKQHTGSSLNVDLTKDFSVRAKRTMIGKVAAYKLTSRSVLLIKGQAVKMEGRTIIAVIGDIHYIRPYRE
jgi:hypothetical protein